MTPSADQTNDDKPGTALTPSIAGGVDPFIAAVESPTPVRRPWYGHMLDYSAHAAMIVGLVGFAWTVSDHVVPHETAAQIERPAAPRVAAVHVTPAPIAAPTDDIGDLRRANQKMAAEIKALHENLQAVRETLTKTLAQDEIRALSARLDEVKSGLNTAKSETTAQIADLSGKVEALRQPAPKTSKLDRQADMSPTASIPSETKAIPRPPIKPAALAATADEMVATKDGAAKDAAKLQVLAGWVVRDVYDGVAVIEGKRGPMEVVPGVSIPGAGIVKSIDRHGAGWTVTTSKGLLAYAAPQRDYRRAQSRDYYPSYRYDF